MVAEPQHPWMLVSPPNNLCTRPYTPAVYAAALQPLISLVE